MEPSGVLSISVLNHLCRKWTFLLRNSPSCKHTKWFFEVTKRVGMVPSWKVRFSADLANGGPLHNRVTSFKVFFGGQRKTINLGRSVVSSFHICLKGWNATGFYHYCLFLYFSRNSYLLKRDANAINPFHNGEWDSYFTCRSEAIDGQRYPCPAH